MGAARVGRIEAVELLLAAGVDVNAADTFQHETALMRAAAEGHAVVVDRLLAAGADPNLQARVTELKERKNADHPSGGFSALMWAVRNGHVDIVHRLVAGGADLNLRNGDGATATMIAIVNDRYDLAATLVELGADVNDGSLYHAVEMRDATTDWYARDGSKLRANHANQRTALDLIALLLDKGADPNKPLVGQMHSATMCCDTVANGSPFFRAAIAADVEALKLLIAKGADLEWTPSNAERAERRQYERWPHAADGGDERRPWRAVLGGSRLRAQGPAAVSRAVEPRAGGRRQAVARGRSEPERGRADESDCAAPRRRNAQSRDAACVDGGRRFADRQERRRAHARYKSPRSSSPTTRRTAARSGRRNSCRSRVPKTSSRCCVKRLPGRRLRTRSPQR